MPDRAVIRRVGVLLALSAVALLADGWVYHHLTWPGVYDRKWNQLLRMAGYFPLWLMVGLGLILHDWTPRTVAAVRGGTRRGLLLIGSAALGGAAAEALKIVIRRERPNAHDGAWVFRAWSDHPFDTAHLGLPSSEAAVAFAAAGMLTRLFPRSRALWYALAVGCAMTRVAAGAHFLSDVVLAALLGYVVSEALWTTGRTDPS